MEKGDFIFLDCEGFKPLYLITDVLPDGNIMAWSCPPCDNMTDYYIDQFQEDLIPMNAILGVVIFNKQKQNKQSFILSNEEHSITISKNWIKQYSHYWQTIN